jgi:hypothetical protein
MPARVGSIGMRQGCFALVAAAAATVAMASPSRAVAGEFTITA